MPHRRSPALRIKSVTRRANRWLATARPPVSGLAAGRFVIPTASDPLRKLQTPLIAECFGRGNFLLIAQQMGAPRSIGTEGPPWVPMGSTSRGRRARIQQAVRDALA